MTHDEYLALLAHELRGPIAAISAAAQVLRSSDPASHDAHDARDVVERQAQRMRSALDELLELGRLTSQGPRVTQSVDLVALLRGQAGLQVQSDVEHAWVETDAGLLQDALSRVVAQSSAPVTARIAQAANGNADVLTIEATAGGAAIQFVRVLLEHAGADARMETGTEGRRLVADLPAPKDQAVGP